MTETPQRLQEWITDIEKRGDTLPRWQVEFVREAKMTLAMYGLLSTKHVEILEYVWKRSKVS